jgi:ketosteroid isomerase-like protein
MAPAAGACRWRDTWRAMSENLDLVRSIFADWERGDFDSVEWADPEIEFEIADGPAPGRWIGLAGMVQGWRDFLGAWEVWRGAAEGYRDLDGERVLVLIVGSGRGKTSGLDAEQISARGANLFYVRNGRVVRLIVYFNRERALADLGLAE